MDNAQLLTVVCEDGQTLTEATLAVRNNARQYLEAVLPKGAELWSAFVDEQAVRPSLREGRILLPLERAGSADSPVRVQLVYAGSVAFPARRGRMQFESPSFDMPVQSARWQVFLPPDYEYKRFEGSMLYEPDAKPQRNLYSFSLNDYLQVEGKKVATRAAQASVKLAWAKQQLADNEIAGANTAYQQVRDTAGQYEAPNEDVQRLAKDLRRAQASNLFSGQNDFVARNWSGVQGGQQAAQVAQPPADVQEEIAAQQYDRLQQAQEIAVAKVRPLHVNVPQRGVSYAFMQTLQTEILNPMTIRFTAVNARGVSLPLGLTLAAVGFVVLWILASLALGLRKK
jgi:hypothetical protein